MRKNNKKKGYVLNLIDMLVKWYICGNIERTELIVSSSFEGYRVRKIRKDAGIKKNTVMFYVADKDGEAT